MRILHTADWHVGKTLRGRSRADEHRAVLAEVARLAAEQTVDLAIVAGDLFDTAAPSPEAEAIVYQALLDLAASGAHVIAVAGNHDHPRRLEAVKPLLHLGRVHVAAQPARPDQGGVVTVTTRSGETARLALLPFLSQRAIVRADDLMTRDADEHAATYAERARRIIAALTAEAPDDSVNLVVGHLLVAGGLFGGGERPAHSVFDYAVPATAFPGHLHYAALGHLHRTQQLPGACPLWYAGSPLQLDFGETANQPAVVLVEAAAGVPAEVRQVPLQSGRRLRTLRGSLEQLGELSAGVGDDHLRIVVEDAPRSGLADQVRELFPTAVDVVVACGHAPAPAVAGDGDRLSRSPRELFREYLAARDVEDPRLHRLFDELLDEAYATDPT